MPARRTFIKLEVDAALTQVRDLLPGRDQQDIPGRPHIVLQQSLHGGQKGRQASLFVIAATAMKFPVLYNGFKGRIIPFREVSQIYGIVMSDEKQRGRIGLSPVKARHQIVPLINVCPKPQAFQDPRKFLCAGAFPKADALDPDQTPGVGQRALCQCLSQSSHSFFCVISRRATGITQPPTAFPAVFTRMNTAARPDQAWAMEI